MFMKRKEALITILYYEDFYRFQMVCNTSLKYLLFENQPYGFDITHWWRYWWTVSDVGFIILCHICLIYSFRCTKLEPINIWTIGWLRNSLQTIRSSDHCVQDRRMWCECESLFLSFYLFRKLSSALEFYHALFWSVGMFKYTNFRCTSESHPELYQNVPVFGTQRWKPTYQRIQSHSMAT